MTRIRPQQWPAQSRAAAGVEHVELSPRPPQLAPGGVAAARSLDPLYFSPLDDTTLLLDIILKDVELLALSEKLGQAVGRFKLGNGTSTI